MLSSPNDYASGPWPCTWLSHVPWYGVTRTTTAASLPPFCLLLPKPAFLLPGKTTGFPGSCLVTAMGSGWFPNTFSLTGSLRTGPSTFFFRRLWPSDGTFRFFQPPTFAGLQFSWHHRPRMPALGWSYLTFVTYRLTPAHPFLHVRVLVVGLHLTTRTCSLEADQLWVAWFPKLPG
jgi:hypothetical protein